MKHPGLSRLLAAFLALAFAMGAQAQDASPPLPHITPPPPVVPGTGLPLGEARRIVQDTFTTWQYVGVNDDTGYAVPENVIRAALFGAYDARVGFDYEQSQKKEKGEKPAPLTALLFSVGTRSVTARQVVLQADNPVLFEGVPPVRMEWGEASCNVFIDRQTVELAALRFTGRAVTKHIAPKNALLTEAGYFVLFDGMGDSGLEVQLERVERSENGYVLTGTLKNLMGDKPPVESFRLSLVPGDTPGAWKRETLTIEPLQYRVQD